MQDGFRGAKAIVEPKRLKAYIHKMPILPEEMPTFTDETVSKQAKTPM